MSSLDDVRPSEFEATILERFDSLVRRGEIFYEPPKIDIVPNGKFKFQVATASILNIKPIQATNDSHSSEPIGPFVDPPEEMIVARIGSSYKIIMNKYCMYRPMLILHTSVFEPQANDLNEGDLNAGWDLLHAFQTPQMLMYNCGVKSGCSQAHKHLQVFPKQEHDDFRIWPSQAPQDEDAVLRVEGIPFEHFLCRIPINASAMQVFNIYQKLLKLTKSALERVNGGTDYNLFAVSEWIILIPRTSRGSEQYMANAANMVGLIWVKSDFQRAQLSNLNLLNLLGSFGVPSRSNEMLPV